MSNTEFLLQAVDVPIVQIDGSGSVEAFNERAAKIFGARIMGRHFSGLFRGPEIIEQIERSLETRTTCHGGIERSIEGKSHLFHVTIAPLEESAAVLTLADVTAEFAASQSRSDFVANVSHELRTPLTAITGMIETLQSSAADDAEARSMFLSMMEKEAARMNRLVQDLLSLSRVEDEATRSLEDLDICDIISEAAKTLDDAANERGMTLKLVGCDAAVPFRGDRDQLKTVMLNLIENAIKYSAAHSDVTITLSGPQMQGLLARDGLRIDVADRGEGIAPEHIARLTERFFRVDTHRSRESGGTGLGLAIVKHILTAHGGRLRIASTTGEGSIFSSYLPVFKS